MSIRILTVEGGGRCDTQLLRSVGLTPVLSCWIVAADEYHVLLLVKEDGHHGIAVANKDTGLSTVGCVNGVLGWKGLTSF